MQRKPIPRVYEYQSELYLDYVCYKSSIRWLLVHDFLTGLCHFCLYEKSFFVKHQPKLYLVDV